MKLFFATLVVWWLAMPLWAAEVPTPVAPYTQVPKRILYQRHVPRAVLKLLPRKARSRFFGVFRLSDGGAEYGLHLWSRLAEQSDSPVLANAYSVDIVEKSRSGYHLINHVPFVWKESFYADSIFDVQRLWIDPQQQQKPVIRMRCFVYGERGDFGDNVLLMFTHGMNKPCVLQDFPCGSANSGFFSGYTSQYDEFNCIDLAGKMKVKVTLCGGGVNTIEEFEFPWDGRKFIPTEGLPDSVAPIVSGWPKTLTIDAPHSAL